MSNRWPIWPSLPEPMTGAFHQDRGRGWKPARNACRKSEDTLRAGMKGMLVAPGTAGASQGQCWFILPKTRLHTRFQRSSEGENPRMLFSINGHGRGWREGGKEVAAGYLHPLEVTRSWAISWLHILMRSWVIYLSLFLYQDLFSTNYPIKSQTERRRRFRKCQILLVEMRAWQHAWPKRQVCILGRLNGHSEKWHRVHWDSLLSEH